MRLAFAPHLAGRMLPGMFAYLGIGIKERFPGDPYAHQEPWAAFFWMHTTACMKHEHVYGKGWGLERSWTIPVALREPRQAEPAPMPPAKPKRVVLFSRSKSTTVAAQCELFAGVRA